ncbi:MULTISPECIES: cation transporter [Paenibacillus]|uniref:Heavy-metal-associated domain-containing protein n=1 Tax=Paenibacillus lignilyticus TaxID=1172615 RepID=A0ABS5CBJ4_9BACL|nr:MULTISPECIES: cation transporter [Paenibacillus]MBP3963304.1 heavy-metal-associated domain-containing protein [Paenibacillus lignilyticus]SFS62379.1 copper chaperone [Paenibacillus sp. BC26]
MTTTIQVKGMSCQHCVNSIEGALKKNGVAAKVDLPGNRVMVDYEEKSISLDRIKTLIEDQGFDVV